METSDLRIALFSGNYNYVRDGANQALNRLVEYLLRTGAQVRVYSPTVDEPAFEPQGELVSLPSLPIPTRAEYRLSSGINRRIKRDLEAFKPNVVHVSAPDVSGHRAVSWARRHCTITPSPSNKRKSSPPICRWLMVWRRWMVLTAACCLCGPTAS